MTRKSNFVAISAGYYLIDLGDPAALQIRSVVPFRGEYKITVRYLDKSEASIEGYTKYPLIAANAKVKPITKAQFDCLHSLFAS